MLSRPVELARPISSHTARTLGRLLETTVAEGTGKKAQIPEGLGKIRCSRLYRFSIGGGLYAQKPD